MGELLSRRRVESERRFQRFRGDLQQAVAPFIGKCCVFATGSFGRGEASVHSDLDLFIAGYETDGEKSRPALGKLDETCLKASLIELVRQHEIPDFSGDGEYLVHYTREDLIRKLGRPEDDVGNTFTVRLLLLLESQPLMGDELYGETVRAVIEAYWRDFEDHQHDFVPAYLANDILRMWRTFCVNYEARTATTPPERKAKRKLKNYKLKHSRLLTCYSGLMYLLGVYAAHETVRPEDAMAMVSLSPTARLEWAMRQPGLAPAHDLIGQLVLLYESFLERSNAPEEELIARFMDAEASRGDLRAAGEFGDTTARILEAMGRDHPRFFRLLLV